MINRCQICKRLFPSVNPQVVCPDCEIEEEIINFEGGLEKPCLTLTV